MKQRNCWSGEAGSQGQMELGFGGDVARGNRSSRNTQQVNRANRAQWWFSRMRQVVDHALDRQPAQPVPDLVAGNGKD